MHIYIYIYIYIHLSLYIYIYMRLSVNKVCGHRREKVHSFLVMDEGPGPIGPWAHMGPGPIWAPGPYEPRPIWARAHMAVYFFVLAS